MGQTPQELQKDFNHSLIKFSILISTKKEILQQKQLIEIWQKLSCILIRKHYPFNGFLQILKIFSTQLFPKLIKRINSLL